MAEGFTKIPRCQPGGVSLVSSEYANQLIDALNALCSGSVAPTANVGSMKLAGGMFILDLSALDGRLKRLEQNISTGGGGGLTAITDLPFAINNTSANGNVATVNVRYATVGSIVPNGIATDISLTTPTSNTTIFLNIAIDNNGATTAAQIDSGNSVPADSYSRAYKLIGNVRVAANTVAQIDQSLLFSQTFVACNRNVSDPNTTPGTYYWQVS